MSSGSNRTQGSLAPLPGSMSQASDLPHEKVRGDHGARGTVASDPSPTLPEATVKLEKLKVKLRENGAEQPAGHDARGTVAIDLDLKLSLQTPFPPGMADSAGVVYQAAPTRRILKSKILEKPTRRILKLKMPEKWAQQIAASGSSKTQGVSASEYDSVGQASASHDAQGTTSSSSNNAQSVPTQPSDRLDPHASVTLGNIPQCRNPTQMLSMVYSEDFMKRIQQAAKARNLDLVELRSKLNGILEKNPFDPLYANPIMDMIEALVCQLVMGKPVGEPLNYTPQPHLLMDSDPQEESSSAPTLRVGSAGTTEPMTKVQKECARFHKSCQTHRNGVYRMKVHSEDDDRDTLVKDFRSLQGMRATRSPLDFEIQDFHARLLGHPNIGACLVGKDEEQLRVYIHDLPDESPFAGGIFNYVIQFREHQEKHNFSEILACAPEIYSETTTLHPNYGPWDDQVGGHQVILSDLTMWRPRKHGIMGILEMLVKDLEHPSLKSPLSPKVADMIKTDPEQWERTARLCTQIYAMDGVHEPVPDAENEEDERLTKKLFEDKPNAKGQAKVVAVKETAKERQERKANAKEAAAVERERKKVEDAERKDREKAERLRRKEADRAEKKRQTEANKEETKRQREADKEQKKRQKLESVQGGRGRDRGGQGQAQAVPSQDPQNQGNQTQLVIDKEEDSMMVDASDAVAPTAVMTNE